MLFQTVQLLYWLGLATWFGSAMFVMLAAPVIFRTVKENNPILSHVLSVNLDSQHSMLLADSIMFNLISRLMQVQVVCACTLLITLTGQLLLLHNLGGDQGVMAGLRCGLFLAAVAVMLYDWQLIWPKIQASRAEYLAHADEPEIANPAKDRFDQHQRKSLFLLAATISLLAGMILFSATISNTPVVRFETIERAK